MNNYDNFFLPTDDLYEAVNFYTNLGLSEKFNFSDKGMIAFSVGEEEPAIILKDIARFPDQKPTIWFVLNDVLTEYKKLEERGIRFISKPYPIGTGIAVEFKDPFGNVLGITDYSKRINNE